MTWNDFRVAVEDAEQTLAQADHVATTMAKTLKGRLRKVDDWNNETLKALKKELSQFNAATGKWKEEP